jgi:protein-tyrosine-phosphatase
MGRSPTLAAYTNHFSKLWRTDIKADSAGSFDRAVVPGSKASENIRKILAEQGILEIERHGAKLFTPKQGEKSDYILTAGDADRKRVMSAYPREDKVFNAREFVGLEGSDIKDAYHSGMENLEAWRSMVNECEGIAVLVIEKLKKI